MLSVLPFVRPSDLANTANGRLWPSQLESILLPGVGLGHVHRQMYRAVSMLQWVSTAETGQTVTATSNGDDYRPYEVQLSAFYQRYTPTYDPAVNTTADPRIGPDGRMWYKRKGVAAVATPGTSNHGWGCAIDLALWVQDAEGRWAIRPVTSNVLYWGWLASPNWFPIGHPWRVGTGSNAESFGLSWEMQSEPWHLRLVVGDNATRRVRDMEQVFGIAA